MPTLLEVMLQEEPAKQELFLGIQGYVLLDFQERLFKKIIH